jgi:hypothetical protein
MLALLAAFGSADDYRARFPLPDRTVPEGWGVNIHFTQQAPGELAQIRAGGFRWVRMDLFWHEIEREKGKYDFTAYRKLLAELDAAGLRALFILCYGNDLYEPGAPKKPESQAAFAAFVAQAVREFRGRGVVWEMWNEPNLGKFWQPAPDPDQYAALANRVGDTIRTVAPGEWYVGPAVSGFDMPFLEAIFRRGVLRRFDAVTVHPYRPMEPESVTEDWSRLRTLLARYTPAGKTVPVLSGEWGYSELYAGLDKERQARYVARQYLINLRSGVPLSIWYDWKNDGTDPAEPEHYFGTVDHELRPKPAYQAAKVLAEALAGYRFAFSAAQSGETAHLLAFRNGDAVKWVGWSTRTQDSVTLPDGSSRPVTDMPTIWDADSAQAALVRAVPELPAGIVPANPAGLQRALAPFGSQNAQVSLVRDGQLVTRQVYAGALGTPFQNALTRYIGESPARLEVELNGVRQTALLQPAHRLRLRALRAGDQGLVVAVENPDQRAFRGELRLRLAAGERPRRRQIEIKPDTDAVEVEFTRVPAAELGSNLEIELESSEGAVLSERLRLLRLEVTGEGGSSATVEGDEKIAAAVEASTLRMPTFPFGKDESVRVAYSFAPGWRYALVQPRGPAAEPLPGRPARLSMWVHGDGRGQMLRARFVDSTGQTFQPDYGRITWKGWRLVSFALDRTAAGRWGGANDGIVHLPIRIDALAVIDSYQGQGGTGEILLASPTVTLVP